MHIAFVFEGILRWSCGKYLKGIRDAGAITHFFCPLLWIALSHPHFVQVWYKWVNQHVYKTLYWQCFEVQ